MLSVAPEVKRVKLEFRRSTLEKFFSELVSKKLGFPVEVELDYDEEGEWLEAFLKDPSRYSKEQLEQLRSLAHLDDRNEGYSIDAALALTNMTFSEGVDPNDWQLWAEPQFGRRDLSAPEEFSVCLVVPYDYFESTLKQKLQHGWTV